MRSSAALLLLAAGCNVSPTAEDGCGASVEREPGCPAAAVVVMSDFLSSQIALTRLDGSTLCGSFASSARSEASPLAFPFSGDLVAPSARPASGRVVLLDRFGTNVVSWLEPETGRVLGQLALGTGFQSNPQDYVEVGGGRALVTRWGENPMPGSEPLDLGGDVLVIDSERPALLSSIALPRDGEFPPRPAGITLYEGIALVTLQRASLDVKSMGEGEIVGVGTDSEELVFRLPLPGLKNCGPVTLAPSGTRAAVACTGYIDPDGVPADLAESAIVLLDLGETPPREERRFPALEVAGVALQANVAFFREDGLLVKTQTPLGVATSNRLLALDLQTGQVEELAEASSSPERGGQGIVYGGLFCTPGCGDVCLMADADRGVLQRWSVANGAPEVLPALSVRGTVGLPPRDIGSY